MKGIRELSIKGIKEIFLFILLLGQIAFLKSQNLSFEKTHDPQIDSTINLCFQIIESQISHKGGIYEDSLLLAQFIVIDGEDTINNSFDFVLSIYLIESITQFPCPRTEDYFSIYVPTSDILAVWKKRIKAMRNLLVWDEKGRINRKDIDVYSGRLLPLGFK